MWTFLPLALRLKRTWWKHFKPLETVTSHVFVANPCSRNSISEGDLLCKSRQDSLPAPFHQYLAAWVYPEQLVTAGWIPAPENGPGPRDSWKTKGGRFVHKQRMKRCAQTGDHLFGRFHSPRVHPNTHLGNWPRITAGEKDNLTPRLLFKGMSTR